MADLLSDVLVGVEHLTGYVERHSVRVMADDRASLAGGAPFDAPGDDAAEGRIASVLPTASASNDPTEPIAVPPIAVPPTRVIFSRHLTVEPAGAGSIATLYG